MILWTYLLFIQTLTCLRWLAGCCCCLLFFGFRSLLCNTSHLFWCCCSRGAMGLTGTRRHRKLSAPSIITGRTGTSCPLPAFYISSSEIVPNVRKLLVFPFLTKWRTVQFYSLSNKVGNVGVVTSRLCSIMLDLHLNLYYWILMRHTASSIQNQA